MYLGLDIGTSGVKAMLVDEAGEVASASVRPLGVSQPHPLWSEQNPDDWVDAAIAAIDDIAKVKPSELARVSGLGLSGQMHGAVLLDENDKPLRPAILWNDGRAYRECKELEGKFPALIDVTGNVATSGFTAPKLLWVANNEPEIFARVSKVLLPKAYVRFRLTGEMAEDMSDASGTLWLDVAHRRWSEAALDATHLDLRHVPRLVEGTDVTGFLAPELARRWGMSSRVVVAGGAGDCAASALGLGAIAPGDSFLSLGTSGVLFAVTESFSPNPALMVHAFCHALPNLWHQMGVMLSAASSLSWLASILQASETDLIAPLGDAVSGPSLVQFLPYLSGERTPHNDAKASGALVGLRMATSRTDIVQAVLEGVAFAARDNLAALKTAGTEITEVDFAGGGTRSVLWAQILADVLGIAIHSVEDGELGAALGAAKLGRLAATGESAADVCTKPRRLTTFEPRDTFTAAYDDAYATWRDLYPALKERTR